MGQSEPTPAPAVTITDPSSAPVGFVDVFQKLIDALPEQIALVDEHWNILAVNPAWNFVVINLGDKNGVVNNAELLVKRGKLLVGKVRITSVEPSTSIADIVANSVPSGVTITPNDQVIYQAVEE